MSRSGPSFVPTCPGYLNYFALQREFIVVKFDIVPIPKQGLMVKFQGSTKKAYRVFLNLHKRPEKVPQSFAAHAGITFISCVFLEGDF